jgi:hypothetical protein
MKYAVAQLVEALRYKPEGRGLDSQSCKWNSSLPKSFRPHYESGVDSASNRNYYQKYLLGGKGGQCLGPKILPPSYDADCLEILWAPTSWNPRGPRFIFPTYHALKRRCDVSIPRKNGENILSLIDHGYIFTCTVLTAFNIPSISDDVLRMCPCKYSGHSHLRPHQLITHTL